MKVDALFYVQKLRLNGQYDTVAERQPFLEADKMARELVRSGATSTALVRSGNTTTIATGYRYLRGEVVAL